MSISTYFNGSYIMSFLKVMTLILVHLEEFQNKHALIRISLADKVILVEDSKNMVLINLLQVMKMMLQKCFIVIVMKLFVVFVKKAVKKLCG